MSYIVEVLGVRVAVYRQLHKQVKMNFHRRNALRTQKLNYAVSFDDGHVYSGSDICEPTVRRNDTFPVPSFVCMTA